MRARRGRQWSEMNTKIWDCGDTPLSVLTKNMHGAKYLG